MNRLELRLLVQILNRIGFLQSQLGIPFVSDAETALLQAAISRQEGLVTQIEGAATREGAAEEEAIT